MQAAWVRVFDQPLYRGAIPFQHQVSMDRAQVSGTETPSWHCDYGTWYFWYAVGDMIARNDREKVAYTRYIFETPRSFDDDGIDIVDRGLKRAERESVVWGKSVCAVVERGGCRTMQKQNRQK